MRVLKHDFFQFKSILRIILFMDCDFNWFDWGFIGFALVGMHKELCHGLEFFPGLELELFDVYQLMCCVNNGIKARLIHVANTCSPELTWSNSPTVFRFKQCSMHNSLPYTTEYKQHTILSKIRLKQQPFISNIKTEKSAHRALYYK